MYNKLDKAMNKFLIKPMSAILGGFAMKPVAISPIIALTKRNINYNFATGKDPKNQKLRNLTQENKFDQKDYKKHENKQHDTQKKDQDHKQHDGVKKNEDKKQYQGRDDKNNYNPDKINQDKKANVKTNDGDKKNAEKASQDKKPCDVKLNISKKSNWQNQGGATVTGSVESHMKQNNHNQNKDKKDCDKKDNKEDNLNKHKKQGQQLNAEKKTKVQKDHASKDFKNADQKDKTPGWQRDDKYDPRVQQEFKPKQSKRDEKYQNQFVDRQKNK